MTFPRRALAITLILGLTLPVLAGPTVVPTAEGQIGEMPSIDDKLFGPPNFESIRGQAGDLVFGGISVFGGALPPPPEVQFLTDRIHGAQNPIQVGATASVFNAVDKVTPDSGWSRNAADDGDFVAFSFAVDGVMPQTLTVRIATFDETGSSMIQLPIIEDLETFMFPDPTFAKTGVAIDNQGRPPSPTPTSPAGYPRFGRRVSTGPTGGASTPTS